MDEETKIYKKVMCSGLFESLVGLPFPAGHLATALLKS